MPHLKKNLKKAQMLEDRYTEIEKQNRTLLANMHAIMRNPSATTDNHNNYKKYSKSLNIRRRRENLDRIVHDNLLLLERLKTMEPYYDKAKWESDHARSDKIMKQLMEYEYLQNVPVAKPKRLTDLLPEISPFRPNSSRKKGGDWHAGAGVAIAYNDKGNTLGAAKSPKKKQKKRSKRVRSRDVVVDDAVEIFQFPSLAVEGVDGEGDSAWDVSLVDVCGNPETGEKSYFVLRGQKVTRDKNSEIKLTTSQLEAYCRHNQVLMEIVDAVQNGQRLYKVAVGPLATELANEIMANLRCTKDGLKLMPAPQVDTEVAPNDDEEEKSATPPRILKRAVKSANGERILITATQTDGEIIIRGFDPVGLQRAEMIVKVAPNISEEEFEQTVMAKVNQLQMSS